MAIKDCKKPTNPSTSHKTVVIEQDQCPTPSPLNPGWLYEEINIGRVWYDTARCALYPETLKNYQSRAEITKNARLIYQALNQNTLFKHLMIFLSCLIKIILKSTFTHAMH